MSPPCNLSISMQEIYDASSRCLTPCWMAVEIVNIYAVTQRPAKSVRELFSVVSRRSMWENTVEEVV